MHTMLWTKWQTGFHLQIVMISTYRHAARRTTQSSTFKVKSIKFPNHGLCWNIQVPMKSITTSNIVPCSHTQQHKNEIYIPQQQILEKHCSDFVFKCLINTEQNSLESVFLRHDQTQSFHSEHSLLLGKARSTIQHRYANTLFIYSISKVPNSFNI